MTTSAEAVDRPDEHPGQPRPASASLPLGLAKLCRPRQWIKNLLVFVAPGAAGVIHGDFERGFIACETTAYDDYIAYKGESGARDAGKLRLEGKEYVVADGDVMHFRFNN